MPSSPTQTTILDTLGTDLIAVLTPVSICMLTVTLLIFTLSPAQTSLPQAQTFTTAATLVYTETPTDSPTQKLEGAILNSLVFILIITLATFFIVLLYYYNLTSFLKHYLRFSSFSLLLTLGGPIFITILSHFGIPIDGITFCVSVFNFASVGALSIFGNAIPIVVTQTYTVLLGIITACWFAKLPEWTTWTLLISLSVYDLVAVLAPGGPLNILVKMAQSRDDDLPALVYESRPSSRPRGAVGMIVGGVSDESSIEMQNVGRENNDDEEERERLVPPVQEVQEISVEEGGREGGEGGEEEEESRGIKLGLGDFVFYGVLVGRAAMYDLMTVCACYLAIISGLACTLILLSLFRRALPALPISITLGVVFYFLTRLLMEPFVVQVSTNLLMF